MFRTRQRGFTILLASIISAAVLVLGAAIFSIAQKQSALASASKQSQYAFYAADTGSECALYWDTQKDLFATVTPAVSATCDAQALALSNSYAGSYPYTVTFTYAPNKNCVKVKVTKCNTPITHNNCVAGSGSAVYTQVEADGYNVACNAISTSNMALERSVVLNY